MGAVKLFWDSLSRGARTGLVGGVLLIVLLVGGFGYWALHTEYRVLFSDLSDRDMSTMAAELDKMKVAYRPGADGRSLLVPESQVHKTRLTLMGRDLPLHGAVGFELFNNMEFGVSEFVQKVNYQRALQGELTRTILSIDEVQAVRVHLALPEQSLFRKDASKPKASVTLSTKPGRTLQAAQVQGIQRLVAASVPEVQAQDVTVLDQHGVALSRASGGADSPALDGAATQLDAKRTVETYLSQKAAKVLDQMFGAGESVVSVDAVFSHEQVRTTTEEVLPARGIEAGQVATGVVTRERQTLRDAATADASKPAGPSVTSTETDYQTGKRTEQVITPAGGLKQLNVAVVVKRTMSEAELQRVHDLVAASVGANRNRGDVVTVHSMEQLQAPAAEAAPGQAPATAIAPVASPAAAVEKTVPTPSPVLWLAALLAAATVLIAVVAGARRNRAVPQPAPQLTLSDSERTQLLHAIQRWASEDAGQRTP